MSWLEAVPAFLASLVVILGPGALVATALRLGPVASVAVSGAVGVLALGVAGALFGLFRLPFGFWQPLALAVVAGVAARLVRPRRAPTIGVLERTTWRGILLTMIAAGVVIATVAFGAVPSPERVSQTYDNVFHMSAIAAILDGGSASSLTLRTLIETNRTVGYYPAAWHTLVAAVAQLSGSTPTVAVNASWLAVAVAIWVPGVTWLAQMILKDHPTRVAVVAAPLATGFAAMPYGLLSWGSLYPTFLATALLPAALAVPIRAARALRDAGGLRRWRAAVQGSLALGAVVALIAFSQPRVLASWALILTPLAIGGAVRALRVSWRSGGRARRRAGWSLVAGAAAFALGAGAAFVYLVTALGIFERPLDERLGGPQAAADQTVLNAVLQVAAQSAPTGVGGVVTWPAVFLAGAVLAGIFSASRTRGLRWIVVAYVAVASLFVLAAASDDVFAKLATALWYKDRYRLSSLLPVLGVPLATFGILRTVDRLPARHRPAAAVSWSIATAWLVTVTSAIALAAGGATAAIGHVFRMPEARAQSEIVSQAQIEFFEDLATWVPADQRVLGDPWDGSGWTQVYGAREPVFPHVNGQWDAARLALAYRLDAIATDPTVCAALDELRVRHVVFDPHEFGGGDPAGNHFAAVHRAVDAGLFAEVASDDGTTLYRIEQCGPLP